MELLSRKTITSLGRGPNENGSHFSDFAKKMMAKWGHEELRHKLHPTLMIVSFFHYNF